MAHSGPDAAVARVRETIEVAFGGLEPPDFADQLAHQARDPVAAQEMPVYRELAGRRWPDLDATYLAERWSYIGALPPDGYQYYLPALLWRSLDQFPDPSPFLHSVVYSLGPRYYQFYTRGHDRRQVYRTSLFTPAQRQAVCTYLELIFDHQPVYRFRAAAALRWVWKEADHPGRRKAQAFHRQQLNYQAPVIANAISAALAHQIRSAFTDTPYPGDDQITQPRPGDDEAAEYALEFRGARWARLHPGFLAYHAPALSFFTPAAFRYFLPAYLRADLLAPKIGVESNADPVFHLTYGLVPRPAWLEGGRRALEALAAEQPEAGLRPEDLDRLNPADAETRAWAEARLGSFNRPERQAIVAFLRFRAADGIDRADIDEALERYWLPSLA